jgi:hypothetical protein
MPKAKTTSSPLTAKQQAPLIKSKLEPALGFRTPSFFKGKPNFQGPKFNPSQFRTQHKGGS